MGQAQIVVAEASPAPKASGGEREPGGRGSARSGDTAREPNALSARTEPKLPPTPAPTRCAPSCREGAARARTALGLA